MAALMPFFCHGQATSTSTTTFDSLYSKSLKLSSLGLYAESVEAISEAIKIASDNNLEEHAIMARVDLAELMRKTQDFESGLRVIQNIKNSEAYPLQHVRLLDRSISIHSEGRFYSDERTGQIVQTLLDSAISLAVNNGFRSEEGLLKHQKGYSLDKSKYASEAIDLHLEAADIFLSLEDSLNYINAMMKALVVYGNVLENTVKADSITSILLIEIEGKEWYVGEAELFGYLANNALIIKKDTLSYYKWEIKHRESLLKNNAQISSREMDNFRVQQETLRFQQEAATNALAFEIQKSRAQTLMIFLSVLALAIISVAILFSKERKLKRKMRKINDQLKVANGKYQMLMVESNHRIKNNLQMVISMLEIASRDVDSNNKTALKKITSKIHTISLLHRHLYTDVHNEFVSLSTFFEEIVKLNTKISAGSLHVNDQFDPVNIRRERIVYFGLILNEMLSNTIEHCREELKKVELNISKTENGYEFHYQDNSAWGSNYKRGTGSQLIEQLVKRIGGLEYSFNPNNGHFKFNFYAEG